MTTFDDALPVTRRVVLRELDPVGETACLSDAEADICLEAVGCNSLSTASDPRRTPAGA